MRGSCVSVKTNDVLLCPFQDESSSGRVSRVLSHSWKHELSEMFVVLRVVD